MVVSDTDLFIGSFGGGVFHSTDKGVSWSAVNTGLEVLFIRDLCLSGANLYAGTMGGGGIFRSANNGASWTAVNAGLRSKTGSGKEIYGLAVSGSNIFAGTNDGVFRSDNNGESWSAANSGLPYQPVWAFAVSDTNIFAGTEDGVFRSTDNGANWTAANTGLRHLVVEVLAVSGTNLFAGTSTGGVFLSTDNGATWTAVNTGLTNLNIYALAISGMNLYAGTWGDGVFLSSDHGAHWTAVNTGLTDTTVCALAVSGTNLFAGCFTDHVWKRSLSEMVTSVEGQSADVPGRFTLDQNFPNPFNPSTTISFTIPSKSYVSLKVFDVMGRDVSTLVDEALPAGAHARQWNASGMPSGVYFYRLQAGAHMETKRLVVLK